MKTPVLTSQPSRPETATSMPLKKAHNSESDKKKLYKASRDMESMFMYYVLRAMRQTVPQSDEAKELGMGGGLGKDIYTQIFDEELSKKMAGMGNRSLAEVLYRSLSKSTDQKAGSDKLSAAAMKEILPKAKFITIKADKTSAIPIDRTISENSVEKKVNTDIRAGTKGAEAKAGRRMVTEDMDGRDVAGAKSAQTGGNKAVGETRDGKVSPAEIKRIVKEASEKYELDPALLEAVIKAESSGDTLAVSEAGAKGIMQLADTTASDMGVKDVFDPEQNIHGGARFLRKMLNRFGDLGKALAAYNAGPETVKRYGGIPPYPETRKYVQTVLQDATAKTRKLE